MKKVLIITYYWPPAGGAGVQRWLHFTKHLPSCGWQPVVLTVSPEIASYPQLDYSLQSFVNENTEVIRTSSNEILQVYGKLVGKKNIPSSGFSNNRKSGSISRFIRGNFFLPDARKGWNKFAYTAAKNRIAEGDIHAVVTTGPPHSSHLIGLKLKKELGIPWLVDLRDPWSKIYYNKELLRTSFAIAEDEKLEKEVLKNADECVTVSKTFASGFESLVQRNYKVITNGFSGKVSPQNPVSKPREAIVAYIGSMADSYKPQALFKAMAGVNIDFKFKLAGSIPVNLLDDISLAGLSDKTDYLGYINFEKANELMNSASLLIVITPEGEAGRGILPGKLFQYLKSRIPILCLSEKGSEISEVLNETKAGKSFTRNQENEMSEYISDVLKGDFEPSQLEALQKYSRVNITKEMAKALSRISVDVADK